VPPPPCAPPPSHHSRPQPSSLLRTSPQLVSLHHLYTRPPTMLGTPASTPCPPEHSLQRPPPQGCVVRACRRRLCPKQARESSPYDPQALPPAPGRVQLPVRWILAGQAPTGAQGLNCESPNLSRDLSAQQGYTYNPLKISRGPCVKIHLQ
jgi:hypothetical protein